MNWRRAKTKPRSKMKKVNIIEYWFQFPVSISKPAAAMALAKISCLAIAHKSPEITYKCPINKEEELLKCDTRYSGMTGCIACQELVEKHTNRPIGRGSIRGEWQLIFDIIWRKQPLNWSIQLATNGVHLLFMYNYISIYICDYWMSVGSLIIWSFGHLAIWPFGRLAVVSWCTKLL